MPPRSRAVLVGGISPEQCGVKQRKAVRKSDVRAPRASHS